MDLEKKPYLFSAVVGQEKFKTAYLCNIVNPRIGGLLISGPKGTGKSMIVHSVQTILPEYETVDGCDFNCDPDRPRRFCSLCRERDRIDRSTKKMKIVNLPLSCTEDRLLGSIDIERLLKNGERKVLVGLLGEANRNILYVDEVNLLPDHLVDDILDAAASPWNTIEREGISISHPDQFILVGTMNPEEGELRPQILDRFPLCIKVESILDPEQRVEIVKRNLLYESNPDRFSETFERDEEAIRAITIKAKELLPRVAMEESFLFAIAEACAELKVDGQRPDIIIVKTCQTVAALDGRTTVGAEDILLAAELALSHRTRDGGLLEPPTPEEIGAAFSGCLQKLEPNKASSEVTKKYISSSGEVNKNADEFLDRSDDDIDTDDTSSDDAPVKKK
ncbi:MAG: ATP-binding protein [candidate division Zixibacteria bacterium]|nr:ATP-binding protein [candidate division Zixibacteria bacterium]